MKIFTMYVKIKKIYRIGNWKIKLMLLMLNSSCAFNTDIVSNLLIFKMQKHIDKSYSPELVVYCWNEHKNLYHIFENKEIL